METDRTPSLSVAPIRLRFFLVLQVARMTADVIILSLVWDSFCDVRLQEWLLGFSIVELITTYLRWAEFTARVRQGMLRASASLFVLNNPNLVRAMLSWRLIHIVWFVTGNYQIYTSTTCSRDTPLLYFYAVGVIVSYYAYSVIKICLRMLFGSEMSIDEVYVEPEFDRPRELTEQQVQLLRPILYNSETQARIQDPTCVICLTDYVESVEVVVLSCRHHYHLSCLRDWLIRNPTCPLCKQLVFGSSGPENTDNAV